MFNGYPNIIIFENSTSYNDTSKKNQQKKKEKIVLNSSFPSRYKYETTILREYTFSLSSFIGD